MNDTNQKLIFEFNKNSAQIIKIYTGQNDKKEPWIDIRIWFLPQPQHPGAEIATKKGIRLSAELVPKLLEGLRQAQEELTGDSEQAEEEAEKA